MDVRAAVAHKAGAPLAMETVQLAGPKAGEVLVEIKATGICHTDEFTRSGADPEGLFPAILGHEGAGIVVEIGAGVREFAAAEIEPNASAWDREHGFPDAFLRKVKEIYRLGLKHGMRLATISGVNGVYTPADIDRIRTLALAARSRPRHRPRARLNG